jgi:hypothetical protein
VTKTPAIYLMPNGGGYAINPGVEATSLPDGYTQLWLFGKYGDATIASLGRGELGVLRDRIDDVLRGGR